jgi:hypothetical protein
MFILKFLLSFFTITSVVHYAESLVPSCINGNYDLGVMTRNPAESNNLQFDWTSNTRPNAAGSIKEIADCEIYNFVTTGEITFPDEEKSYTFYYYANDLNVYWNHPRGGQTNIWQKTSESSSLGMDIFGGYGDALLKSPSGKLSDLIFEWSIDRPCAIGKAAISCNTPYSLTGFMDFPDDRRFTFFYYSDDDTIYWDGKRGSTNLKWTRQTTAAASAQSYLNLLLPDVFNYHFEDSKFGGFGSGYVSILVMIALLLLVVNCAFYFVRQVKMVRSTNKNGKQRFYRSVVQSRSDSESEV